MYTHARKNYRTRTCEEIRKQKFQKPLTIFFFDGTMESQTAEVQMKKTLAQLKRDVNSRSISLELISRYGQPVNNKELLGKRKIGKIQTNGFYLIRLDGRESWLEYPKARDMYYDDESLTIYQNKNEILKYKVYRNDEK